MSSMTSIEEIVKYQQELLNHQRNQKLLQKETIKLLNALNKNLTFMSDRLDEFALKTNIKLDEVSSVNSSPTTLNNTTNLFNKLNNDLFLTANNINSTNSNDTINLTLVNNTNPNTTTNGNNNLTSATIQQLISTATPLNIAVSSAPQTTQTILQPAAASLTPKQTSNKTSIKNATVNSLNSTPSNAINNSTNTSTTTTNNNINNNNRPYNKNQKVKEYFQFQNDNDSNLLDNKLQTYSIKLNSINNSNNNHINSVNNNCITNNHNNNKLKNSPMKLSNKTINSLTNANLSLTAASATTTTVGPTIITAIPITTTTTPAITAMTTTNQLTSCKQATIKQVISPISNSIQTVVNSVANHNTNGKRLIKDMNDNRTNRSAKLLDVI